MGLPVQATVQVLRAWRAHADALDDQPEEAEPTRSLHCSRILDGRVELTGSLDAVVVDLDDLEAGRGGRSVDGTPLSGIDLSTLLCDSALHRLVTRGRSTILDYGASTRTIPAPLWNALVIRDQTCRFPGCDRPSQWGEGHHVVWVERGGATKLSNLVLVCSRHHHRLHRRGWQAKLRPDAALEVTAPDGRHWVTPSRRRGATVLMARARTPDGLTLLSRRPSTR